MGALLGHTCRCRNGAATQPSAVPAAHAPAKRSFSTMDPHPPSRQPATALPASWQRLAALSGIAFTVFLLLAWFMNGAETPHYLAPDHDWTTWANNTEMKGRFAAFFALLAGLSFLPFAATIRALLGDADGEDNGRARLAHIAHAGGLIGITSFV